MSSSDELAAIEPTRRSTLVSVLRAEMEPERRYTALLIAGLVAIALWTLATTLYVDWLAYSPLPWGDDWDYWRQYIAQSGLTPQFLFTPLNEHRTPTGRLLFWADQYFFSGRNLLTYASAVIVQLAQAGLLWWLGMQSVPGGRWALPLGGLVLTAAFSGQQFTNFTWAIQMTFLMVYLFAHASLAALWRASGHRDGTDLASESLAWFAMSIALAWLSTYSMSNGLLIWPILVLLGGTLGMRWRALAIVGLNGAAAWFLYFNGHSGTGSLIEGIYQLPRSLIYALVVLGLPVDNIASAIMRTFGLPAPPYPGLGGDSLASQAWRPAVAATVGAIGLLYGLALARPVFKSPRRARGGVLVLLHCALFLVLTALLIGIGRSPRFDIVAVMQSRYSTPALLFWSCLGILFLVQSGGPSPDTSSRATARRLQAALVALLLSVGISQPAMLAYARGYADYLGEVQEAMAADVYSPEIWGRIHYDPATLVPIVDYLRREGLSLFSLGPTRWRGQLVSAVFRLSDGCVGYVDEMTPQPSDLRPGVRIRGWAWDDRDGKAADNVVLTDADGIILGLADTVSRRDDVTAARAGQVLTPWVGWRGFAPASATEGLQAYLVRDGDHTACKIGNAHESTVPAAR